MELERVTVTEGLSKMSCIDSVAPGVVLLKVTELGWHGPYGICTICRHSR